MTTESRDAITWALNAFRDPKKAARRTLYADYYEGRHKLNFATDKFLATFGELYQALNENLCPLAVDPLCDVLQVEGFLPVNIRGKRQTKAIQGELNEIWRHNRMKQRMGMIHREVLLFEETHVIVWPDAEEFTTPIIFPTLAGSVVAKHHPTKLGYFVLGAHFWVENDRIRLNIFFPDRTEKYVTTSKQRWLPSASTSFTPYYEPGDREPWPLPNPWAKVPIFRFVNDPNIAGDGKSELRDIVPIVDGNNKSLCDMMVAGEFESFAQRVIMGFEPEKDKHGNPRLPFRSGPGNVWTLDDPNSSIGEFSRGDVTKFLAVQDGWRASIARLSATPLHFLLKISGDWPSGEALKTACARLTNKAIDRSIAFGSTWEDIMRFALEISGRSGVQLESQWRDPTPQPDELTKWQTALLEQQAGVSVNETLRERGFTDERIERMAAESIPGDGSPEPNTKNKTDEEDDE